ncbi:Gfo/Idh/MocA family oxidoreductase [Acaryochloris sp. IP29b_bin.137]|uniref:Gfo/Idh/MocA family protein n=1 Tax=Acaryochloris sp. IP29b_bin.137 TaxID=2969217 RepID=UPI00261B2A90|nr:Gfo/Idh/MocA family oxidoreductase [Acaryochloris sp. IP29b_bin.137]
MPADSFSPSVIGVAVVGTGFGQKVHIPAFRDYPGTDLVAVYNRDLAKAVAIAQSHNIPYSSNDLGEILSRSDVQGVSISTPPFLHYEMATQVLQAKKHLFLEKPTTLKASEARKLYQLAQQQGIQATLNFEFRFVPAWMQMKALLAENYVGQPRLIKIDWLVPGRADPNRPWSWHASKDLGGGSLGALASHTFDYITWLFGPAKRICARLVTTIPSRPDPKSGTAKVVDADDTCVLILELTNGTTCQVNISATTYAGRGHWVEVYGDRGTLVLGSSNPKDYIHGFQLKGSQTGAELQDIPIPDWLQFEKNYPDGRIAPTQRVVEHWTHMIQHGQTTAPSLKEGVYSQLLMDAAHQSHQQGTWIEVPNLVDYLS